MPIFLYLLFFYFPAIAAVPNWVGQARQLIGVGDAERRAAVERLRGMRDLEDQLRKALHGEYKFYALDVISVLQQKIFLDELLKLAAKDENGAIYLAINTLLDEKNVPKVREVYRKRLDETANPPTAASQVVILDTLTRMGVALSQDHLQRLLLSDSFEVRASALYHLEHRLQKKSQDRELLSLVLGQLSASPYQQRLRALHCLLDLKKAGLATGTYRKICQKDKHPEVKRACLEL